MRSIAIIGKAGQRDAVVARAAEMGLATHVFAWRSGEDAPVPEPGAFHAIGMHDADAILRECHALGVAGVVPVGSDVAARSATVVAEALGLAGNPPMAVERATSKVATRKAFAAAGLPQPAFATVGHDVPEGLAGLRYPLVVKPSDRSGGRALRLVRRAAELPAAVDAARDMSHVGEAVVEEFVDGTLYSCECLSFAGRHEVVAITRREVREVGGVFCEAGYLQPSGLSADAEADMGGLAARALDALGLAHGTSSVEVFRAPDGRLLLNEVTPAMYGDFVGTRLTGLSTGVDYVGMAIWAALGEMPGRSVPPSAAGELELAPTGSTEEEAAGRGEPYQVRFVYCQDDLRMLREAPEGDVVESGLPAAAGIPTEPSAQRFGHYIMRVRQRAYGGAPPLVLPPAGKRPAHLAAIAPEHVIELNSEVAAFRSALQHAGAQAVHLPWYMPPAWEKAAAAMSVKVRRYRIGRDFVPTALSPAAGEAVVLGNHHGLAGAWIREQVPAFAQQGVHVIIDDSMAFWEPPVMTAGVYNVYAPRKFFPVPDGGLLAGAPIVAGDLRPAPDIGYKRARMLLMALEFGEEAPYKERMANEQDLIANPAGMSALARKMLESADCETALERRALNFDALHKLLAGVQELTITPDSTRPPQFYPLLVEGDGQAVRDRLVAQKVFAPLMWRHLLDRRFDGAFEGRLARNLICLPIDQRYTPDDMTRIADVVREAFMEQRANPGVPEARAL